MAGDYSYCGWLLVTAIVAIGITTVPVVPHETNHYCCDSGKHDGAQVRLDEREDCLIL